MNVDSKVMDMLYEDGTVWLGIEYLFWIHELMILWLIETKIIGLWTN